MTREEFKDKVTSSPNFDTLQSLEVEIKYPHLEYKNKIVSLTSIYDFVLNQIEGFEKLGKLPSEFESVKKQFVRVKTAILSLITQDNANKNAWASNFAYLNTNNPVMFLHDLPETEFLLSLNSVNVNYYRGAFDFIAGNLNNLSSKPSFIGYLMAYEFISKADSQIVERKEKEKKSFSKLRADLENQVNNTDQQLVTYLSEASQKYTQYIGGMDTLKATKDNEFKDWFNSTTEAFKEFDRLSTEKIKELESLYTEKLKLEAPAKYWSARALKLKEEGTRWLWGLIICVGVAVGILIWILTEISAGNVQKVFGSTGTAIKWSVVVITIVSFLAFMIRIFSKLTFSSFHLVRDAEEREQLTYVYLALQKEQAINESERHLVMQSLFSRADSGLLKEEASPTMPSTMITDKFSGKP